MELITELQVMDEKTRIDVRFITVMDWLSHTESYSQNERVRLADRIKGSHT
jgi:hypothetical protein